MLTKQKLALGIGIFIFMAFMTFLKPDGPELSLNSLKQLEELNKTHQIELYDLNESEGANYIAGVQGLKEKTHKSANLLALLKEGEVLLLKPTKPISSRELNSIAQDYKKIPEFKYVEWDQPLALSANNNPIDLDKEGQAESLEKSVDSEVRIGIFDSGIDMEHPFFSEIEIEKGWDATQNKPGNGKDEVGHGTHVAGIIAKETPSAHLVTYKIADLNGGKLSHLILALQKALEDGELDIMNMSLGVDHPSNILKELIREASNRGIIMVAAAGNKESDIPFYPAYYEEVIAVGSSTRSGHTLKDSNYGEWVDIAAVGHYIESPLPHGEYGYQSGTSQAAAYTTAFLAKDLESDVLDQKIPLDKLKEKLNGIEKKVTAGNLKGLSLID